MATSNSVVIYLIRVTSKGYIVSLTKEIETAPRTDCPGNFLVWRRIAVYRCLLDIKEVYDLLVFTATFLLVYECISFE